MNSKEKEKVKLKMGAKSDSLCAQLVDLGCQKSLWAPFAAKAFLTLLKGQVPLDESIARLTHVRCRGPVAEWPASALLVKWAAKILRYCEKSGEERPDFFPEELLVPSEDPKKSGPVEHHFGWLCYAGFSDESSASPEVRYECLTAMGTALRADTWEACWPILTSETEKLLDAFKMLGEAGCLKAWSHALSGVARTGYRWSETEGRKLLQILGDGSTEIREQVLEILQRIPSGAWKISLMPRDRITLRQCLKVAKIRPAVYHFIGLQTEEEKKRFRNDLLDGLLETDTAAMDVLAKMNLSDAGAVEMWLRSNWKKLEGPQWCRLAGLLVPYGPAVNETLQWLMHGISKVALFQEKKIKVKVWPDDEQLTEILKHSLDNYLDNYCTCLTRIAGAGPGAKDGFLLAVAELRRLEERYHQVKAKDPVERAFPEFLELAKTVLAAISQAFSSFLPKAWHVEQVQQVLCDAEHGLLAAAAFDLIGDAPEDRKAELLRVALLSPASRVRWTAVDRLSSEFYRDQWFWEVSTTLLKMLTTYERSHADAILRLANRFNPVVLEPAQRGLLLEIILEAGAGRSSTTQTELSLTQFQNLDLVVAEV